MERRLIPLNGVLALLHRDGAWFSDLVDQGFALHALELDVQSVPGVIRADVVMYRIAPDLVVLCECKSGRNVEERQALGYQAADLGGLRHRSSVPAPLVGREVSVYPLYAALEEHRDDVAGSLQAIGVTAPVLEIGNGVARLAGELPPGLASFDRVDPRMGLPPARIRLDRQSPVEEFMEVLVQRVVAAQARRERFVSLEDICASVFDGLWAALGAGARRELQGCFKKAFAQLKAGEFGQALDLEGSNDVPARIVIRETPAGADPRGAPQAWQGQRRRAARDLGREGPPITERRAQLSFDDLSSEEASERDDPDSDAPPLVDPGY